MRGRTKIRQGVDPAENYQFLGPLSPGEITRLSKMETRHARLGYLSVIYGGATARHAYMHYLEAMKARKAEEDEIARIVTEKSGIVTGK
jgi:hypothetical protein